MDNKWTEADEVETPGQNNSWDMRGRGWRHKWKNRQVEERVADGTEEHRGTDQIKTQVA